MLQNRAPSSLLLTLILHTVSLVLLFSPKLSYMTTNLDITGEMLAPSYSLSHDINSIVLNMHPRKWICLTQLQQPGSCLFLALVYHFFDFLLAVPKNLENMVNVKFSNLIGIEAWTYGFIF